ncbi:TetR/AcrR family transcriptional regulator [Aquihabitans sp. G128]|uniref:TetR/AcrR family transcriptional regulator n=1 Tax=Aquihabitans sp. G128 TaxID=2849779 RepID=UPI001C23C810|nr:TetR/AcrR family transcriptional regulator [Aquihabitans sp. G128]QXC61654.1 TetR/AcrR family transcriptional regulator [Aquihabitans sp. G128]
MPPAARTRRSPEARRAQLLELGVELLASRTSLDDLPMDELAAAAGISKGLVFHYFGSKRDFQLAVAEAAADQFFAVTEPDPTLDLDAQLEQSIEVFVAYVRDHRDAYVNLVRGASSGDEAMRALFDRSRGRFVGRILERLGEAEPSPLLRLAVRGWVALAEELTLAWADDPEADGDEVRVLLRDSLAHVVLVGLTGQAVIPTVTPP